MAYISFQPSDFFNPILYSGTAGTQTISGVGFQPDMTWLKARSESADWGQFDAVRGATKDLSSNNNNAESTLSDSLTSWNSDGFVMGSGADFNASPQTYVSYNWKAGTTSGLSGGTITPTGYSFNTTACFSAIAYTGNSTSGATVPHGLGVVPKMILVKALGSADNWTVYHSSLGATKYLVINTTAAAATATWAWNDTAPTSSLFSLGNAGEVNGSGDYIAYCFANVKGYSKFGSYTGNGNANGTFVYTGFRPAYVLLKRTVGADAWQLADNKRLGYNFKNAPLVVSASVAEDDATSYIDILSNGFKLRTTGTHVNNNGELNIYMAFAEFPIVSSNDMPTVAR